MTHDAADRILWLLKTGGEQTAAMLGRALAMTAVGARRHLLRLQSAGLVAADNRTGTVGRPKQMWRLTRSGHASFPDRHADLMLQTLNAVRRLYGEEGLERLIAERERDMEQNYGGVLADKTDLRARVEALAAERSSEGYMADVQTDGDDILLVEGHCPICSAAKACASFCKSELAVFRKLLGPDVEVERKDHLLAGAKRCTYRVSTKG